MGPAILTREHPIIFSGPSVIAIQQDRKTQTRRIIRKPETYTGIRDCAFCCPKGVSGDRLWVRETWATRSDLSHIEYRASHQEPAGFPFEHIYDMDTRWNNAMFMPRKFSRLLLEITEVRVQRLQEIDEADAQREGWAFEGLKLNQSYDPVTMDTAHQWFRSTWDHHNAKRGFSWSDNPWVWAISFKRLSEAPHAC